MDMARNSDIDGIVFSILVNIRRLDQANAGAYLEPCQTSLVELFCQNN